MAYNTPELLLVGAAQTLVLEGSLYIQKDNVECFVSPDIDGQDRYQTVPGW